MPTVVHRRLSPSAFRSRQPLGFVGALLAAMLALLQPAAADAPPTNDPAAPAARSPVSSDDLAPSIPAPSLPPQSALPGVARPVPDYNGRPTPTPSATEALLWAPRLVLLPAHLVFEGLVRRPLVVLSRGVEEHHVVDWVKRILLWRGGRSGLIPTFLYDFGLSPSAGFVLFHDGVLDPGQYLTVQGGFWDGGWTSLKLHAGLRTLRHRTGLLSAEAQFVDRPDRLYFGVGSLTSQSGLRNFRQAATEARLRFRGSFTAKNRLSFWAAYHHSTFGPGRDPSVSLDEARRLPGWSGYQLLRAATLLELDSRDPDRLHAGGSGVRLELRAMFAIDPTRPGAGSLHFLRWGGEAGGYLDLTGAGHVLGLRFHVELLEQTGAQLVPFTELVTLGGPTHLQGYLDGRFRGYSAVALTAEYRWPIWALTDATVFMAAGNVFGPHLEGLAPGRVYLSWGTGLRSGISRHVSLDLLVAFGTSRLDVAPVGVESVRALFGISHGF